MWCAWWCGKAQRWRLSELLSDWVELSASAFAQDDAIWSRCHGHAEVRGGAIRNDARGSAGHYCSGDASDANFSGRGAAVRVKTPQAEACATHGFTGFA